MKPSVPGECIPVGTPPRMVTIKGYYLPMVGKNRPVMLNLAENSSAPFVPIFSTTEKLELFIREFEIPKLSHVATITDGEEFISSIFAQAHVILDCHKSETGKARFLLIQGFPQTAQPS